MGSTGKNSSSESYDNFADIPYTYPTADMDWDERTAQDKRYVEEVADRFRKYSNLDEWFDGLSSAEYSAIEGYVGNDYEDMNGAQYNTPWEDMDGWQKEQIANLHNALNKFKLNKGIEVYRETNFKIFESSSPMSMSEIREYLSNGNEVKQIDGFMSFSTHSGGSAVAGRGLVIEMSIAPSVSAGAGAYIGNTIGLKPESEFLTNTNSVLRFDKNSMYVDGKGRVHIKAEYLGRSEAQTISPTYTGLKLTGKGAKKSKS